MAEEIHIIELKSLKVANVESDGDFPETWTDIYGILQGSANINIAEGTVNKYNIEESAFTFASSEGTKDMDFTVEMVGVDAQQLAPLIGATYAAGGGGLPEKMTFPPAAAAVFRAWEVTGINRDGKELKVQFAKTRVFNSFSGAIGRGQFKGWTLRSEIMIPLNSSGVAQPPMRIYSGDPVT